MAAIELDRQLKVELVEKIQSYFKNELDQDIGAFDAEFLLDFFAKSMGPHFYNQALADVLKSLEVTMETFTDSVYGLEKEVDSQ